MAGKTKITIPKPCQENWLEMTPLEQGRFCQLCQKNVFDFTTASDREILEAYNKDQQLCGRFTTSQLNRDLHIRKEKSSIWVAATSAIVSFIGLGTNEVQSQETIKVEQTDKKILNEPELDEILVKGEIFGKIPDVLITVKNKKNVIYTDENGKFSIKINKNDTLVFSKKDYLTVEHTFDSERGHFEVYLPEKNNLNYVTQTMIAGNIVCKVEKKRTFLGSMFHSIGNWFR